MLLPTLNENQSKMYNFGSLWLTNLQNIGSETFNTLAEKSNMTTLWKITTNFQ